MEKVYFRNTEGVKDLDTLFVVDTVRYEMHDNNDCQAYTTQNVLDYGTLTKALDNAVKDDVITYIGEF